MRDSSAEYAGDKNQFINWEDPENLDHQGDCLRC